MSFEIKVARTFLAAAKPLRKKYPSLDVDLASMTVGLESNPRLGTALGNNLYKLRLAIRSKGRGKSGGARVITHIEAVVATEISDGDHTIVTLLTIYDKSDYATFSHETLLALLTAKDQ